MSIKWEGSIIDKVVFLEKGDGELKEYNIRHINSYFDLPV